MAVALASAACATARPPTADRWWSDLGDYEERLQKFSADAAELVQDFMVLREDPEFPAVEEKIKEVAAQVAREKPSDPKGALINSLWSLSLRGLTVFRRYLALSTRVVTLEATQAELEGLRLDLRLRRMKGEGQPPPAGDPSVLEKPVTIPFRCTRYAAGNIEFANCY